MATTTREGAGGGGRGRERERRTNPLPQQPKKPSQSQPSSPSSQKPLPNYLKPTISSSLDFSSSRSFRRSNIDRPASSSADRRRSYDKPPPPAHLQKALHATNTRPTSTNATRTPHSIKPAPQRSFSSLSSRSTKAPSLSTVRSFSAKASPSNSNSSLNRVVRKQGPKSVTSESSVDFEGRDNDILDHVIGSEQHEAHSLPEISEMQEAVVAKKEDEVLPQGQSEVVAEVGEEEQETAGKEDDQVAEPVVAEEKESTDKSNEEIVETSDHANQGKGAEEDSPKVDEKHVVVELEGSGEGRKEGEEICAATVQAKLESHTKAKAEESPAIVKADESPTIAKADESPAIVKVDESPAKAKADESPAIAKADASPAKAKIERPARQMQPGKKGAQQAYNDVIEETASKLMERRNKVRALAGAFETVISLQDTK